MLEYLKHFCTKQRKERKKHNKLLYLGQNKLNFIEMLISEGITDRIIDHNEFKAIIDEKKTMITRKTQQIKVNFVKLK